jgi:hypothetical protein
MEGAIMQRPTGVTILAILAIIGGVLGLLASIALIGLGGASAAGAAGQGAALGGLAAILGGVGLLTSLLSLAFGIGAWMLKPWAWTLGIVAEGLSILLSVFAIISGSSIGSQIVSIVIAAAIIYYLMTPTVKQAFGRA